MRKSIAMLLVMLAVNAGADDGDRVRMYLSNLGYSNTVNGVDFKLRNDGDDRGTYIETWGYSNAIPTLAQCPSALDAAIWAEADRQARKPLALRSLENNFLQLCDALTSGHSHARLGFDELEIVVVQILDVNRRVQLSLQLLALDARGKREGGLTWWDDCVWHPELAL